MISEAEFNELAAKYEAGCASQADLEVLEPFRVKRAVLLASGFGSRMLPITINTPKPLVNVNGRRIIESLLDALVGIGVEEIYIATGYLAEQFELLKAKYPAITLVYNPLFVETNNISSACAVVASNPHAFENAYAFESDLFLSNPDLLKKYVYHAGYFGVPVENTADWCFDVQDGLIKGLHKGGQASASAACYHMFGISHWTAQAGAQLAHDLPAFFAENANKQRFWDDCPCVDFAIHYTLKAFTCSFEDIAEIDSFAELQEIDPRYRI